MVSLSACSASERTVTASFRHTKVPTGSMKALPCFNKEIMMDVCCVDDIIANIVGRNRKIGDRWRSVHLCKVVVPIVFFLWPAVGL